MPGVLPEQQAGLREPDEQVRVPVAAPAGVQGCENLMNKFGFQWPRQLECRRGCENLMNKFGFQWPRQLECSRFPEENTSNGCISKDTMVPAEVTLLPVINNEPAR
ncbi:hypothetical protein Bbelb_358130 [Branchiostoma belcheri]|nr:hypothetical protein Bbelb_358130 [Branchiostoma belcheri]